MGPIIAVVFCELGDSLKSVRANFPTRAGNEYAPAFQRIDNTGALIDSVLLELEPPAGILGEVDSCLRMARMLFPNDERYQGAVGFAIRKLNAAHTALLPSGRLAE